MDFCSVFLDEIRPSYEELAKNIFYNKTNRGMENDFTNLKATFSYLFPGLDFDVYPSANGQEFTIIIKEGKKEFRLQDSASGYFEALYLFSILKQRDDAILLIDEPALH